MDAKPIKRPPWKPETIARKVLARLRELMANEGYDPIAPGSPVFDELAEEIISAIKNAPRPFDERKSGT